MSLPQPQYPQTHCYHWAADDEYVEPEPKEEQNMAKFTSDQKVFFNEPDPADAAEKHFQEMEKKYPQIEEDGEEKQEERTEQPPRVHRAGILSTDEPLPGYAHQ